MKAAIIVNGYPRAGKDTAVSMMRQYLDTWTPLFSKEVSSIDPVRNVLKGLDIDVTQKTPADRLLLATIGDAIEQHSQAKTAYCVEEATGFWALEGGDGVVFMHIREPAMIKRISRKLRDRGASVFTVFVEGNRAEKMHDNAADNGVEGFEYSHRIHNNGTREQLYQEAKRVLCEMGFFGMMAK